MNKILKLLVLSPLFLASCAPTSSYKALVMISENHANTGSIRFSEFEGTYVFKLNKQNPGEGAISYTASIEEGNVKVTYIAFTDEELNLFSITSGESLEGSGGYIEKGYRVHIIIRSDGKVKNGSFTFDLN